MPETSQESDIDQTETKTYELGYLLSPLVDVDKLEDTISHQLEAVISEVGGQIESRLPAERRTLAYPVAITKEHKRQKFTEAYFGAIRFKITPDRLKLIDHQLKSNDLLLRFLLVIIPTKVINQVNKPARSVQSKPSVEAEDKSKPIDKETIDKEIEDLLTSNI